MGSQLEALSIELIEMLVDYLELQDIRSLRRTSRILEKKASQGRFTTFFTHKNVELATRNLQDMVRVTRKGRPGCRLQYCTISGIVRAEGDEKEADEDDEEEHSRLLAEAFGNLKKYSLNGGITSLCLSVTAMESYLSDEDDYVHVTQLGKFRSQIAVWNVTSSTFNITMAALEKSQLLVHESLDVFGSVKGCSLSCDIFETFARNSAASQHIFRALKKLTLSLSAPFECLIDDRTCWKMDINVEYEKQASHSGAILQRIPLLLRSIPALESLDLHWYIVANVKTVLPVASTSPQTEDGIINPDTTIALKECSLQGIFVSESSLLRFLETTKPAALTLIYVHLISDGEYDRIFDFLTSSDSPVTKYHLDDLCKGFKLMHYEDVPGRPKFPYSRATVGPSTLTRSPRHAKKPIRYSFANGRAMGSPEINRWRTGKGEEFGDWRNYYKYNFVALNTPPLWYVRHPDSPSEEED